MIKRFANYLQSRTSNWMATFLTYPLFYIGLVVTAVIISTMIEKNAELPRLENFLIASLMYNVWSIVFYLAAERYRLKVLYQRLGHALGILFSILVFFILPMDETALRMEMMLGLTLVGVAFIIFPSTFAIKEDENNYHTYNANLFYRWLDSFLLSFLLWGLLSLSILAFNELFDIKDNKANIYAHLFVWLMAILFAFLFMSRHRPSDYYKDDFQYLSVNDKLLQFALIPASLVYVVVIIAFYIKSAFLHAPSPQWLQDLGIWCVVLSGITYLLSYPVLNSGKGWIVFYKKMWPFLVLPVLLALSLSTIQRISQMGVGMENYFRISFLLFGWFSVRMVFLKKEVIRIPLAFCALTMFAALGGPLSAWQFSKTSLQSQVVEKLKMAGVIKEDRFVGMDSLAAVSDTLSDQLYELEKRKLLGFLADYDKDNLIFQGQAPSAYSILQKLKVTDQVSAGINPTVNMYREYLPEIKPVFGEVIVPILNEYTPHTDVHHFLLNKNSRIYLVEDDVEVGELLFTDEELKTFPMIVLNLKGNQVRIFARNYIASKRNDGVHDNIYLEGIVLVSKRVE